MIRHFGWTKLHGKIDDYIGEQFAEQFPKSTYGHYAHAPTKESSAIDYRDQNEQLNQATVAAIEVLVAMPQQPDEHWARDSLPIRPLALRRRR